MFESLVDHLEGDTADQYKSIFPVLLSLLSIAL